MAPSNPYGSIPYRAPSQPIEHLASNLNSRPALKTSVSRVWSRCKSINRKTGPPVPAKENQAVWRESNERQVIDMDYEVVTRIVSTHLTKSRTGNGLEPCYTGPSILSGGKPEWGSSTGNERTYHSLSSSTSTSKSKGTDPNRLEYYSHPLFDATPNKYVPRNLPRRPNIHPKLSRGQIAKFRNASGSSSTSTDEGTFLICSCPPGACRHRGGTLNSSTTAQARQRVPVRLFSQTQIGVRPAMSTSSSTSTLTVRQSDSPNSTPRQSTRPSVSPVDTQSRRHLASPRSTAEMKGRSPTTPTSTPKARSRPFTASDTQSFDTSTPRPRPQARPQSGQGDQVDRFPFVCPDRLVQRHRTSPSIRSYSTTPLPEGMSPTFMRPRPAPRPDIPMESPEPEQKIDQGPPLSPDNGSPSIAGMMEYESTCALTPPTPGPIDTETLERLFDEVLQACRTGDIPYKSHEENAGSLTHSAGDSNLAPTPEPPAVARHVRTRLDWNVPSAYSDTGPVDVTSPSVAASPDLPTPTSPPAKASMVPREKPRPKEEGPRRFIPSGRSFEPLRNVSIPNIPMSESLRGDKSVGKGSTPGSGFASGSKSRVKEAIAKFENASSPPTTPLRGRFTFLSHKVLTDDYCSHWRDP